MRISDWSSDVCSSDLDIIPAIAVGAKLERGEIRPRARFRKALAPIILARQDARQIMRALFRRPVMHDDRRDHFQPHWGEVGGAGARAFGGEDVALHLAPPWSAMTGGPVGLRPAGPGPDAPPPQREP